MWTIFYSNFGPPGVVLGMMLIGVISKIIYLNLRKSPKNFFAQVTLALYLPLMLKLLGRGHTVLVVFNIVRVYVPVLIMLYLVSYWQRKEAEKKRDMLPALVAAVR